MKKHKIICSLALIIIILALCLPLELVLGACNPDATVIYTASWVSQEGDPPPYNQPDSCHVELIVNPQVNVLNPTCKVYLKNYEYDKADTVTVELWKIAYVAGSPGHYCNDVLLASATYNSGGTEWNVWHWVKANSVGGGVWMYTDEVYSIRVKATGGLVRWGYKATPGGFPNCYKSFCYSGECQGAQGQQASKYYGIWVQGCWSVLPTVITQDGYLDSQGRAVMGGYVPYLGVQSYVNGYIEYGFTEDLGNEQFVRKITDIAGSGGYYAFKLGGLPPGMTLYYRAKIMSASGDFVDYGDIKQVLIPALIPTIDCTVIQNDQWWCIFETIISNTDDVEAVDLRLTYSTQSGCFNSTEQAVMNEGVTEGGRYTWNSTAFELFDPGQTYYYYAEMVYGESTIVRSDIKSFIRWDPNKSAWENWLDNQAQGYLGGWIPKIDTAWLWWGLAAGLCLIVFFAVSKKKNWKVGCAWGLVSGFVLLYILVAAGLVNPWLVVLLSIVCGFIIYKLIFSHART
jgi:hypothetical protein